MPFERAPKLVSGSGYPLQVLTTPARLPLLAVRQASLWAFHCYPSRSISIKI